MGQRLPPMIERIEARYAKSGKAVDVTMDTETMGFYPWYTDRDIVSISFTIETGRSQMLYLGRQKAPKPLDPSIPLFDQIKWLLTSPNVKLRMANGKFDLLWIAEKWGIECTNFRFDPFNAKFDKGKMETVKPEDLRVYAGGDTDACHQVADLLRGELVNDDRLANFYVKILHPACRAFEKIERRGVLVDRKYQALAEELRVSIKKSEDQAMSLLPNRMRIKYRERIDSQLYDGKSPLLPSILKAYLLLAAGPEPEAEDSDRQDASRR